MILLVGRVHAGADKVQAVRLRHEDIHEDQIHLLVLQETQAVLSTFGVRHGTRPFRAAVWQSIRTDSRHQ